MRKHAHQDLIEFGSADATRVSATLYSRIFTGLRYRRRMRWFRSTIIEPIAPPLVARTIGPYR